MMFDCCKISVSTLKQVSQFVVLPELPYLLQDVGNARAMKHLPRSSACKKLNNPEREVCCYLLLAKLKGRAI